MWNSNGRPAIRLFLISFSNQENVSSRYVWVLISLLSGNPLLVSL